MSSNNQSKIENEASEVKGNKIKASNRIEKSSRRISSENDVSEKNEILPDKGYAWVIMIASFFNIVLAFGSFNAFGVFQTYYLKSIFINETAEKVAWISTMSIGCTLAGGLLADPLIRMYGIKYTSLIGTMIATVGLLLASFSTQIWHYVLTQGVIFGTGSSIVVNISLSVPALWFERHRGLAIGVVASGGGFGALFLIPTITQVIKHVGISWAFRVLCAVYFVVTLVCGLLLKPRKTFIVQKKSFDKETVFRPTSLLLLLSGFLMEAGYNVPLLYFPSSLVDLGKSKEFATNMIMGFCFISAVSRLAFGYWSKKIGAFNITIVSHLITGIATLSMWFSSKSVTVYLAYYFLISIFCASYLSLGPIIIANYYPQEKVSVMNGVTYLIMGLSVLIFSPTTGAVFSKIGHRTDYSQIILIGAIFYLFSAITFIIARHYIKREHNVKTQIL
ncbi:Riboflavin transporter MCH5 [Smittium culicis]|uniref:Riboflavin transporter MCH5 n=1 Tax=Smittium culicis TaxID=133412 RepID=A0A1R1XW69_9FUNG|nr:Riboflavin transporter MCH5 [Smittium culicis]OMJ25945.1 Riboflavin transporter MCH5 [Smittium culicis]